MSVLTRKPETAGEVEREIIGEDISKLLVSEDFCGTGGMAGGGVNGDSVKGDVVRVVVIEIAVREAKAINAQG